MLIEDATIAILVPKLNKTQKPQPDIDRAAVFFKLKFQLLIAAVDSNQQAENENEQVDVGQVHRQSSGQILVVAVAAGQNVKIYNSSAGKQKYADARNANFQPGWGVDAKN